MGKPSRLTIFLCGLITVLLSRPYQLLRDFDSYAHTHVPWSLFSVGLVLVGIAAMLLAFVPIGWLPGAGVSKEHSTRSLPIRLLVMFAGVAYLVVVGLYFAPHAWNLSPAVAFVICPACALSVTVDPSLVTVFLLLAPLSAVVYGSVGAIVGVLITLLSVRFGWT